MIYPQNFEQKTGFNKVRKLIAEKCLSSLGKERVLDMAFSADFQSVTTWLEQTYEFVRILEGETDFPANFFFDVRYSMKRIRPEGTWLDTKELFDLRRSLQTIQEIVRFFQPTEEEEIPYPALTALCTDIQVFPQLISKIDLMLDKFGHIKDNASPELARIRREMTLTMSTISKSLQSILRSAQSEGVVDKDVTPTMRDGRLMIPVAPAFKRKIRGIVHDESASGKTVFIEPEVVVEANNRIRELESDEKREIVRILTEFTNLLRPSIPAILQSYEFLADIDFIRAKALFAQTIGAIRPIVEDCQQLDWARAIHPILFLSLKNQGKQVVPLDIELTQDKRILLISGPNAGGKSVCLKTVGLLQYMLQCGLLVPLHETSRMGIFERLFIDIGDEQSIENDLSTYSSHLTNMKFFVKNSNEKTLLLIDEFGSGTEPQIGGAIAEALLDRFNRHGSFGVITTHYQNLKHFAEDTPGIVNGAMLYDRHQMQPLFKLAIGNPGSSFAIEIARKIGLPEEVIADASEKVGSDYINMDKYLLDIARDRKYWETKRQEIHNKEKRLDEVAEQYNAQVENLRTQQREIIHAAKAEAKDILSKTNANIERTIREIRTAQAEKEKTKELRRQLDEFKQRIQHADADDAVPNMPKPLPGKKKQQPKKAAQPIADPQNLSVGDNVTIDNSTSVGEIIAIEGNKAVVAIGGFITRAPLAKLKPTLRKADKPKASSAVTKATGDALRERQLNFNPDIDVRGMRGDEAIQAVTYFLDDAIQFSSKNVRILHGTGNGILRTLIREYLNTVPGVRAYHDEHIQLGGAGITVVELS